MDSVIESGNLLKVMAAYGGRGKVARGDVRAVSAVYQSPIVARSEQGC